MSQRSVEALIGWLVADADLRERLEVDPIETMAAWLNAGFDVTPREFDGLLHMNILARSHPARIDG